MKTEKTLKIASYFLKFLMVLQITICLSLAFVYFNSMSSPEKYNNLTINDSRDLVYNLNIKEIPKTYDEWKETKQFTYYNLLDDYSKFFIIWRKIVNFIVFFFILYFLDKFLKNTNSLKLFFESNIKILNKIILLILTLFIIDFLLKIFTLNPISMVFEEKDIPHYITRQRQSLSIFIYYPLAIVFFYILKEVFKRGHELKQENELTI